MWTNDTRPKSTDPTMRMERKRKDPPRSGPHAAFSYLEDSERAQRDTDLNRARTWLVHAFVCTAFVNSNSSILSQDSRWDWPGRMLNRRQPIYPGTHSCTGAQSGITRPSNTALGYRRPENVPLPDYLSRLCTVPSVGPEQDPRLTLPLRLFSFGSIRRFLSLGQTLRL